jgi:hypothetical protein
MWLELELERIAGRERTGNVDPVASRGHRGLDRHREGL